VAGQGFANSGAAVRQPSLRGLLRGSSPRRAASINTRGLPGTNFDWVDWWRMGVGPESRADGRRLATELEPFRLALIGCLWSTGADTGCVPDPVYTLRARAPPQADIQTPMTNEQRLLGQHALNSEADARRKSRAWPSRECLTSRRRDRADRITVSTRGRSGPKAKTTPGDSGETARSAGSSLAPRQLPSMTVRHSAGNRHPRPTLLLPNRGQRRPSLRRSANANRG